jgi:hypothetical protein
MRKLYRTAIKAMKLEMILTVALLLGIGEYVVCYSESSGTRRARMLGAIN